MIVSCTIEARGFVPQPACTCAPTHSTIGDVVIFPAGEGMPDHVEAVLIWSEKGASDKVAIWLGQHGFTVAAMRRGLLVSGDRKTFETVFKVSLNNSDGDVALPVPAAIQEAVSSITVGRLRRYT